MNDTIATWFFRVLVWLYPRRFRDDFGDEMRDVFGQRLHDAARDGRVYAVCVQEFAGALRGLVREHATVMHAGQVDVRVLVVALLLGCCGPLLLMRDRTMQLFCDFANIDGGGWVNRIACVVYTYQGNAPTVAAWVVLLPLMFISIGDVVQRPYWRKRRWSRLLSYVVIAVSIGFCQQLLSLRRYVIAPLPGLDVLLFLSLWTLPAFGLAWYDMRRERAAAVATPTALLAWLAQVMGYTVGYMAILASSEDRPLMQFVHMLGASLTYLANPQHLFESRFGVITLMSQRVGIASVCGLVVGNMVRLYGVWRYRTGHAGSIRRSPVQ